MAENPFARLPDKVLLRLLSFLDASEAWEDCRVWALDRRFRRLLPQVDFHRLDVGAWVCCNGTRGPTATLQAVEYVSRTRRLAKRVADGRIGGADSARVVAHVDFFWPDLLTALRTCGRLDLAGPLGPLALGRALPDAASARHVEDMVSEWRQALSEASAALVGALASPSARVPMRVLTIIGDATGDLEHAIGVASALGPAAHRCTLDAQLGCPCHRALDSDEWLAFLFPLRNLAGLFCGRAALTAETAASIASSLPALRCASVRVDRPDALVAFASLPHLVELQAASSSSGGAARALATLVAGPAGRSLRRLALGFPVPPEAVSSIARAENLRSLHLHIAGPRMGAALAALSALPLLSDLRIDAQVPKELQSVQVWHPDGEASIAHRIAHGQAHGA